MGDEGTLRELHDAYVWEVNAAIGENRMDVVWRLVDEFADMALQLMTAMQPPGCGRADCLICVRSSPEPAPPARRGWLRRARRRHVA